MNDKYKKYELLKKYLKSFESVVVAFSGGVDSAFLLKAAYDALGDNAAAITANICTLPKRELEEAVEFCKSNNIRHIVCGIDVLKTEGFAENTPNRCYICKKKIFTEMKRTAAENGFSNIAEGSNLDDNRDYRPGHIAVAELGIRSPLREVGFTKSEIRELSRNLGLPVWDKPSFACLASRFAYGERITPEKLTRVEKAEDFLKDLGICQVRVRIHGDIARIEAMPEDFAVILEKRDMITREFKECGFSYTAMDLSGYRTGSMNETLKTDDKWPIE